MPGVQLIILCTVICCTGGSLAMDQLSASADQTSIVSPAATSTQQRSSASLAPDSSDTNPNSSFLTRKQLAELKRSITRVREDLRTVESGLLDSSLSRDQLIGLQRKATKRLQLLDRRISKYLRLAGKLEKANTEERTKTGQPTEHSPNDLDQIDQQLSSTNKIKAIQDPKFFFSSSSSSSVSPPHFWHVDASASTTRNSSSNGFGSSSSSSNHSSDSLSSGSISSDSLPSNSSNSISANSSDPLRSRTNNSFQVVNSSQIIDLSAPNDRAGNKSLNVNDQLGGHLGDIVNGTSEQPLGPTVDKMRIRSKIDRFVGGFIGGLNNLINHRTPSAYRAAANVKQEKHPFLLYHKCSEGYLQLSANGTLSTGMDANLLAKSEFIFHYLTKAQNHQLQIQTQDDRYLCFNGQGRPEIMVSLPDLAIYLDKFMISWRQIIHTIVHIRPLANLMLNGIESKLGKWNIFIDKVVGRQIWRNFEFQF